MRITAAWPARVLAFVRLGRPHFLIGGIVLHGLGVAIARYLGEPVDLRVWLWGQMAISSVQLMAHYSNDYFDLAVDRANRTPTPWSGGSRVLPDGHLPPVAALVAALVLAGLALAAGAVLALGLETGPLTLPLIGGAVLVAWSYSAPPIHLHRRGLGEILGALLVSGLTPLVGFYIQASRLALLPVLAIIPPVLLQFAMLVAVTFADAQGDATTGKRTLLLRAGGVWTARLVILAMALAYACLPLLIRGGLPGPVALALAATLPLAFWQARSLAAGAWADPAQWNAVALRSIILLLLAVLAEALAFWLRSPIT